MKHHELKLDSEFWDAVMTGDKCFEVRFNDRGFQKGDTIGFQKFHRGAPSGLPSPQFQITYVLSGWGIKEDHVVFGIKEIPVYDVEPTI